MTDKDKIVRAAIHPAIGIARIGNSKESDGCFIGPEVPDQPAFPLDSYKDDHGALKRQVARFRVFGYNADDEVVAELNADNAEINWTWNSPIRKRRGISSTWHSIFRSRRRQERLPQPAEMPLLPIAANW